MGHQNKNYISANSADYTSSVIQDIFTITPKQSRTKCYKRALREEIWGSQGVNEEALKSYPINHPEILLYKARILGGRQTVENFADWTSFLLTEFGPKETCLSLGSGIGRVEKYLIQIGFTASFDAIELSPYSNQVAWQRDCRIMGYEGDLNFIQLQPDSYDFILCHGVLHHLINLEHVLYQINTALKPDGIVLIYEYVGETRWQFTDTQLEILRQLFPELRFRRPPLWKLV